MNREDIIRMARKAGIAKHGLGWTCWEGQLERFAALAFAAGAAAEREACAELCVKLAVGGGFAADCAAVIRARGQE